MIALLILCIGGLGFLSYFAAVYALPFYVGLSICFWAIHTGAGSMGGVMVGFIAGIIAFVAGQLIFSTCRSPLIRWAVVLMFGVPAAIVGYNSVLQLAELFGAPSSVWRHVFAIVAAAVTGWTAMIRLGELPAHSAGQRAIQG